MEASIYKNKKRIWVFLLPAFLFMCVYLYYPFVLLLTACLSILLRFPKKYS